MIFLALGFPLYSIYQPHHATKTINEKADIIMPIKILIPK